jgi:hypothetical protein
MARITIRETSGTREVARALIGRLVERGGTLTIHPSLPDGPIGEMTSR